MRRILTSAVAALLLIVPMTLSAQRYENGLADKIIVLIGNEAIFLSDLEGEIQVMAAEGRGVDRNTRCQVLENMMVHKLFLNQAKLDSLIVSEDNVEMELQSRISNILTGLGSEKAVEKRFGKPLYKLKEEWRRALRDQSLMQQMQQKIMMGAGSSTPAEVEQFFKESDESDLPIISTQYKISQIALYPDQETAKLATKERLLAFRDRIIKGEKFSTIATLYSEDPGSAFRGGELGMASKNLYWPQFGDAAVALKEGQISQIVETPDGFHIIQMIKKEGEMFNARHILLKPKYTAADRNKAFGQLDSIVNLVKADSITFEVAAMTNSEDLKSAISGGVMVDPNTGSVFFEKDQLKPADYAVIKDMKEGEISVPFESLDDEGRSGNVIYKVVKLDKIIPSHTATFKDDYMVIQGIADRKRQTEAIDKFVKEKQAVTYIRLDDLFKQCNFDREGWIK